MSQSQTTTARVHRLLNGLDLEPIIVKALDPDEGYGWTVEFAMRVSEEYRKFLVLVLENPDAPVVPSSVVDDLWHLHILDTLKYEQDCQAFLGFFLHHFPYFGMRGAADARNLERSWNQTLALYNKRFGRVPQDLWQGSKRCPNCGVRCRSKNSVTSDVRPRLCDVRALA